MKIKEITEDYILFDNGSEIIYDHQQSCCEWNYADFKQLDSLGREYEYKEELIFEHVQDKGFLFGDESRKFFIPCYSEQNGCYKSDVEIYFNNKRVLEVDCEMVLS